MEWHEPHGRGSVGRVQRLARRTGQIDGPDTLANRFAFIFLQLSDPQFQTLAAESSRKAVATYEQMLKRAIELGEIDVGNADTRELAETIHSLAFGSMMVWTILREGDRREHLKRDFDALIGPLRTSAVGAGLRGS